MLKAAGIDEDNMPMHQSELTSAQTTLLNKLAQNYRSAVRRYAPVISAHGEILPRLTPQQVEASSHRSLILKVLTHSQPDLVGSSIGSPPYTYGTVESKRSNWRTLPKLEVLEPPADLVNCHSRDERQRRYTSWRMAMVYATRLALRNNMDAMSYTELFSAALLHRTKDTCRDL